MQDNITKSGSAHILYYQEIVLGQTNYKCCYVPLSGTLDLERVQKILSVIAKCQETLLDSSHCDSI